MGHVPECQACKWDTSRLPSLILSGDILRMKETRPPAPDAGFTAHEVYRRMKASGFNQLSLATAADLNSTYVRDILRGKSRNPKSQHIQKLAVALECEPSDLTDPGRSGGDEQPGKAANRLSERAVIEMWRALSEHGKELMIRRIAELLPRDAPPVRKGKDV